MDPKRITAIRLVGIRLAEEGQFHVHVEVGDRWIMLTNPLKPLGYGAVNRILALITQGKSPGRFPIIA